MFELLEQLSILSSMAVALYATANKNQLRLPDWRVFYAYLMFSAFSEIIVTGVVLLELKKVVLLSVQSTAELFFILTYFTAQAKYNKYRPVYYLLAAVITFYMAFELYSNIKLFPVNAKVAQNILVAIIASRHLYLWIKNDNVSLAEAFINIGFFIYSLLSIACFGLALSTKNTFMLNMLAAINQLNNIITNLVFIYAIKHFVNHKRIYNG